MKSVSIAIENFDIRVGHDIHPGAELGNRFLQCDQSVPDASAGLGDEMLSIDFKQLALTRG
jgi:hypothetical protein